MPRFFGRKRETAAPDTIWDVPERFNFTRDVVEAAASDREHRALTFVDVDGVIAHWTFDQLAVAAGRWATLLRSRGLRPGDRLLVLVGKTPVWHHILLGALKAGIVTIPCSEMLRPRDLTYRIEHSAPRCSGRAISRTGSSTRERDMWSATPPGHPCSPASRCR
jgi:acyl-coenzyme A synthetase/AMP-(fatty) acid ligase